MMDKKTKTDTKTNKCGRCGKYKDVSQFWFDKKKGYYYSYCRECRRIYAKYYKSTLFEFKYDWVPIEDDMPFDSEENPNESESVILLCTNSKGYKIYYHNAVFLNDQQEWINADTGNLITYKPIAWTIPRNEVKEDE